METRQIDILKKIFFGFTRNPYQNSEFGFVGRKLGEDTIDIYFDGFQISYVFTKRSIKFISGYRVD